MALGFNTSLRNLRLDQIKNLIDAGAGSGVINIYSGTRPSNGGAVTILLASLTMSDPSFPNASSGSISANPITGDNSANAAGTATWFRITDSNGVFILDGSIGLTSSGSDMELSVVDFVIGLAVDITSFIINSGNSGT